MTTMSKIFTGAIIGASAILAPAASVQAATFVSFDPSIAVETPNKNWFEVADPDTLITLTNGNDIVMVNEFVNGSEIQMPVGAFDEYEEVFHAFYTTSEKIYHITGFAQTKAMVSEVRYVMENVHMVNETASNNHADVTFTNVSYSQAANTGAAQILPVQNTEAQVIPEEKNDSDHPEEAIQNRRILCPDGSEKELHLYADGTWKDDNGISYTAAGNGTWGSSQNEIFYDNANVLLHVLNDNPDMANIEMISVSDPSDFSMETSDEMIPTSDPSELSNEDPGEILPVDLAEPEFDDIPAEI